VLSPPSVGPSHPPVVESLRIARSSSKKQGRSQSPPKSPTSQQDSSSSHTKKRSSGSRHESRPSHTPSVSQTNTARTRASDSPINLPPPAHLNTESKRTPASPGSSVSNPPWGVSRRPPTTPTLLPEHRYCSYDGLIKPFRTHHCRACGTVGVQSLNVPSPRLLIQSSMFFTTVYT